MADIPEILVVEDNDLNFELFSLVLPDSEFRVRRESSGESAVWALREQVPDLVILDMGLPGMSGLEVLAEWRASGLLGRVPVICVSAHAMREDAVAAIEAGASLYLTKPIETLTFADTVRSALRARRATDDMDPAHPGAAP